VKYVLGIDIGTTGIKSALYDADGNAAGQSYRESRLHYPRPGWVEQDPEDFYRGTCETIREILTDNPKISSKDVAAISIAGQMAGMLAVDEDWKPVTHYDSWLDTRCNSYVEHIRQRAGGRVIELSGLPPMAAHCPKLLWWKNERPEVFAKFCKIVMPAGYVSGRMAGLRGRDAFIDPTYCHFTGLYDFQKNSWSEELCGTFGIPVDILPRVIDPWEIIGQLTSASAADCGLVPGVPIVAGCGDQAAGFLGAGLTRAGSVVDVAGTASCFACCVDKYSPDTQNNTLLFCRAASAGLWFPHAYLTGGGLCLRWFRDNIMRPGQGELEQAYKQMDLRAAALPAGPSRLLFVPHLGGRNFPFDGSARGSFVGFSWDADDAVFYKAIMEGIAYEYFIYLQIEKKLFADIDFKEVRVYGGGAKSEIFTQIKADVLGLAYVHIDRDEVGTLGSAIVGGYAVGLFDNMETCAERFVRVIKRVEPDMKIHMQYREYAEAYADLYTQLAPVYKRLADMDGGNIP